MDMIYTLLFVAKIVILTCCLQGLCKAICMMSITFRSSSTGRGFGMAVKVGKCNMKPSASCLANNRTLIRLGVNTTTTTTTTTAATTFTTAGRDVTPSSASNNKNNNDDANVDDANVDCAAEGFFMRLYWDSFLEEVPAALALPVVLRVDNSCEGKEEEDNNEDDDLLGLALLSTSTSTSTPEEDNLSLAYSECSMDDCIYRSSHQDDHKEDHGDVDITLSDVLPIAQVPVEVFETDNSFCVNDKEDSLSLICCISMYSDEDDDSVFISFDDKEEYAVTKPLPVSEVLTLTHIPLGCDSDADADSGSGSDSDTKFESICEPREEEDNHKEDNKEDQVQVPRRNPPRSCKSLYCSPPHSVAPLRRYPTRIRKPPSRYVP